MRYGYDDYDELELQEIQDMKQAEEYYAEQEWIEHMMYEEEKKKPPMSREERYPGVVFTPRQKNSHYR